LPIDISPGAVAAGIHQLEKRLIAENADV